jgi:hypothetical protein
MKNFLFRAHEWLADHFSAVQYPRIRQIKPKQPIPSGPNQLKLWEGLWLLWAGFVGVAVIGFLLVVFGIFVWHFLTGS